MGDLAMRPKAILAGTISAYLALIQSSLTASAQTTVIDYTDRGWYKSPGQHDPTNHSYFVGDDRGNFLCGLCEDNDVRNFFVFDLANLTQPVTSAKLALTVPAGDYGGYLSGDPSENYALHDVTSPISLLMSGGLPQNGVNINTTGYFDIGNGVVYGNRLMTAADKGLVVEIPLNSAGVAAINSARGGLFAIGGSLTTLDNLPNAESVFGLSGYPTDISQLRLTFVPEPTSAALLAFAAMIFGASRKKGVW
jgi:hypothetical protein